MPNYTQVTDFSVKDGLTTGDPEKLILGSDVDAELAAIATAITSKFDSTDVASDAQAAALSLDSVLISPDKLKHALENGTYDLAAGVTQDGNGLVQDTRQVIAGPGISGGGDLSSDRTFALDINALVAETSMASGDFVAMVDITDNASGKITLSNFAASIDSLINHDSLAGFVANEHINHTGVNMIAGNGLTGGGNISASRTFTVGEGSGISVSTTAVAVDSTVVRTTGSQTIGGAKTFSADAVFQGSLTVQDDFVQSGVLANGSTGTLDDVSTTNASIIRFTGTQGATWSLTGLAGGTSGRRMTLVNLTGESMTLSPDNVGSSAANRFVNYGGSSRSIVDGTAIDVIYDSSESRWVPVFGF